MTIRVWDYDRTCDRFPSNQIGCLELGSTVHAYLIGFLLALFAPLAVAAELVAGGAAPDVVGTDLDGKEFRISEQRGKVVVITFWASWCVACARELPALDELQRVESGRLSVVAVNFKESERQAVAAREKLGPGAVLSIVHDRSGGIGRRFGVRSVPFAIYIDHNGRIAHVHDGYTAEKIEAMLGQITAMLGAADSARVIAAETDL